MTRNQKQTQKRPRTSLGDAHQISESNRTLNTFLGGQVPSWMQGTSTVATHNNTALATSTASKTSRKRRRDGSSVAATHTTDNPTQPRPEPSAQLHEHVNLPPPPPPPLPQREPTLLNTPILSSSEPRTAPVGKSANGAIRLVQTSIKASLLARLG